MDKPFPAYKGDEPYIFVCYAHVDDEIVGRCSNIGVVFCSTISKMASITWKKHSTEGEICSRFALN